MGSLILNSILIPTISKLGLLYNPTQFPNPLLWLCKWICYSNFKMQGSTRFVVFPCQSWTSSEGELYFSLPYFDESNFSKVVGKLGQFNGLECCRVLDGVCNPVTSVIEGLGIGVVGSLMSCYRFTYKLE